jgi:hypothetical protein
MNDIHQSGKRGLVRSAQQTTKDINGEEAIIVSMEEAAKAGYPFGPNSGYPILEISASLTADKRDCPVEWAEGVKDFMKDYLGDECRGIVGMERGEREKQRHAQVVFEIRALPTHVDKIKDVLATYLTKLPGMKTKYTVKPFDKSQKFHLMVGYCIKTLGARGSATDVRYLAHNMSDKEVMDCRKAYDKFGEQKLNAKGMIMIGKSNAFHLAFAFYQGELHPLDPPTLAHTFDMMLLQHSDKYRLCPTFIYAGK